MLYKGGSTISVFNHVFYVEDKQKNRFAYALFIHEPIGTELIWLEKKLQLMLMYTDWSIISQYLRIAMMFFLSIAKSILSN